MAETEELYRPDLLPDLIEDAGFKALPYEDRQKVFEKGVSEAAGWVRNNGGWSPETYTGFRQSVQSLREKVNASESAGEKVMGGLRTIGNVVKDSAATLGTTALDLRFADAQDGDAKLRAPLSDVVPALGRNMEKLTDSGRTAFGKTKGGADEAVDAQLAAMDEEISKGEFLKGDAKAWLKQQADAFEPHVRQYYEQQRVSPEGEKEKAHLAASRLDSKQNLPLVMHYLATGNPDARKALRSNLLRLPQRAEMERQDETATAQSDTGRFLDDAFGEGAHRYLSEAGDPLELAGNLTAFLGGKAVTTGIKTAIKGGAKEGLKGLGKLALGSAGEAVSEMGSLFMDDPNATAEDYGKVAKDAAIGSLGLAGLGAGYQLAADQFKAPADAVDSFESGGATPVTPLPPGIEGATDAEFNAAENGVLAQIAANAGREATPAPVATAPETAPQEAAPAPPITGIAPGQESILTEKAQELLATVNETGEVPSFMTPDLAFMAYENGIDVKPGMSAQDIYQALAARDGRTVTPPTSSVSPAPAPTSLQPAQAAATETSQPIPQESETQPASAAPTAEEAAPQAVKFRTFDERGRLKATKEAPRAEAMKELRGRESMLQKLLDCLSKKS